MSRLRKKPNKTQKKKKTKNEKRKKKKKRKASVGKRLEKPKGMSYNNTAINSKELVNQLIKIKKSSNSKTQSYLLSPPTQPHLL